MGSLSRLGCLQLIAARSRPEWSTHILRQIRDLLGPCFTHYSGGALKQKMLASTSTEYNDVTYRSERVSGQGYVGRWGFCTSDGAIHGDTAIRQCGCSGIRAGYTDTLGACLSKVSDLGKRLGRDPRPGQRYASRPRLHWRIDAASDPLQTASLATMSCSQNSMRSLPVARCSGVGGGERMRAHTRGC
jgi:hypothetical protein